MATGPTRTPAQREIGKTLIVRELLQGKTQAEIAELLGVDRSQVSRDWGAVKAEARADMMERLRDWIAGELMKAEMLKGEAVEQWRDTHDPAHLRTWNALWRTQLETLGALQAKAKNENHLAETEAPNDLPRASEIKTAEDGRAALEMLDTMSGGRLLRYTAKRE